jgi:hypothetical protein
MAGPIASLFVKLGMDTREFTQGITGAQKSVAGFTRDAGSRFSTFKTGVVQGFGQAFGLSTIGLVRGAADAVTDFIGDSVDAYKQQEIATARLTTSLNANVVGWQGQKGAIDDALKSVINLGFQDDDFALGLSRVVAATHDVGEGLHIMAVAEDLARFKGISLTDAAEALTKVEGGRYRLLGELGIQVNDFANSEEALAAVEKLAAGQAIAYTETLAGKQDILNAKLNEQQEILGQKLAPAQLAVNQAQLDGVTAAGALTVTLDSGTHSAEEQANALHDWTRFLAPILPLMGGVADQAGGLADAVAQVGVSGRDMDKVVGTWNADYTKFTETVDHTAEKIVQSAHGVEGGLVGISQGFDAWGTKLYADEIKAFENLGKGVVSAFTQSLWDDRDKLTSTANNLRDILKNGLTPNEQALEAEGQDYIKLVREGMRSEKEGAKETAQMIAGAAIKSIEDAAVNGTPDVQGAEAIEKYLGFLFGSGMNAAEVTAFLYADGKGLSAAAIQGIHDKYPEFFSSGTGAANQVHSGLLDPTKASTGGSAWTGWGWKVAGAWITGFKNHFEAFSWANLINSTIGPKYSGQSPPKEGPLHFIDQWGFNVGSAWVKGFAASFATLGQVIGGAVGDLSTITPPGFAVAAETPAALHNPRLNPQLHSGNSGITVNFYGGNFYGGPAGLNDLGKKIAEQVRFHTRGGGRLVGSY